MSVKVLVTGSREFTDYQVIYDALDARPSVTVVRCPADWKNDQWGSAGSIRNGRMLELGPDIVLAFFKIGAKNKGTTNMVEQSTKAGVEVRRFAAD